MGQLCICYSLSYPSHLYILVEHLFFTNEALTLINKPLTCTLTSIASIYIKSREYA